MKIIQVAFLASGIWYYLWYQEINTVCYCWSHGWEPSLGIPTHDKSFSGGIHPENRMRRATARLAYNFDGAMKIQGDGIGAIMISPARAHYPVAIKLRFPYTNNMAGHDEACIAGLEATLDIYVKDLEVCRDSILIISKSIGELGVKSPELAKYKGCLAKILGAFPSVSFNYLPHSKNQFVDALATLSSMTKISNEIDSQDSSPSCVLPQCWIWGRR